MNLNSLRPRGHEEGVIVKDILNKEMTHSKMARCKTMTNCQLIKEEESLWKKKMMVSAIWKKIQWMIKNVFAAKTPLIFKVYT